MLNKKRIHEEADAIESLERLNSIDALNTDRDNPIPTFSFDMSSFGHSYIKGDTNYLAEYNASTEPVCGTAGCIAGTIAYRQNPELFNKALRGTTNTMAVMDFAANYLGLTLEQANQLFLADGWFVTLAKVTPAQAAAVLRNLAETGKVDWTPVADEQYYGGDDDDDYEY